MVLASPTQLDALTNAQNSTVRVPFPVGRSALFMKSTATRAIAASLLPGTLALNATAWPAQLVAPPIPPTPPPPTPPAAAPPRPPSALPPVPAPASTPAPPAPPTVPPAPALDPPAPEPPAAV